MLPKICAALLCLFLCPNPAQCIPVQPLLLSGIKRQHPTAGSRKPPKVPNRELHSPAISQSFEIEDPDDLIQMIKHGNPSLEEILPNVDDTIINSPNEDGQYPLNVAAERDAALVELLLREGADPSCRDVMGRTPLHCAAGSNNLQAVKPLIERGSDPNARDEENRTPLHYAAEQTHVIPFLSQNSGRRAAGIVDELLGAGAMPNAADDEGYMPYHGASGNVRNHLKDAAVKQAGLGKFVLPTIFGSAGRK